MGEKLRTGMSNEMKMSESANLVTYFFNVSASNYSFRRWVFIKAFL
jgi:hypothetical protein